MPEEPVIYPVRSVRIYGVPAVMGVRAPKFDEMITVKGAEDASRALGDAGNEQHCPLCNQYFSTIPFMAHAQSCINANAPRWERMRDREPVYKLTKNGEQKRFRPRLFGATPKGGR
jgi:hypothetical protein